MRLLRTDNGCLRTRISSRGRILDVIDTEVGLDVPSGSVILYIICLNFLL
jgi:hypothetical protein